MLTCDVLVPISKFHKYFFPAIRSIRRSRDVNVRLIIVNNGIADPNSVAALKSVLANKDIYLFQPHLGYSNAMNRIFEDNIELNEFVTCVNSDDLITPWKIAEQIELMKLDGSGVSITGIQKFSGIIPIPNRYGMPNYKYWHPSFLLLGSYGADATMLFRRDVFNQVGPRSKHTHPDLVDILHAFKVLENTTISVNPRIHYFYRRNIGQMSRNRAGLEDYFSIKKEVEDFAKFIGFSEFTIDDFILSSPSTVKLQMTSMNDCLKKFELLASKIRKSRMTINSQELSEFEKLLNIRRQLIHNPKNKYAFLTATKFFLRNLVNIPTPPFPRLK